MVNQTYPAMQTGVLNLMASTVNWTYVMTSSVLSEINTDVNATLSGFNNTNFTTPKGMTVVIFRLREGPLVTQY